MTRIVSILNGGSNNHPEAAASFNAVATDFMSDGVVGSVGNTSGVAPMTGGFAVAAQGTPNTTTQISPGTAWLAAVPSGSVLQRFRLTDDTGYTVTHAANVSGASRYDYIYATVDATKLATPGLNADDVFTYVVSRSTSSSTDDGGSKPTYGVLLAVVTLTNSFSSVVNSNISDKRPRAGASAFSNTFPIPSSQLYNPYKFSAYQSADLGIASTTWTKAQLNTESFDTSGNFDNATNYRFTATVAGFYQFNANLGAGVAGLSTGSGEAALYKNGSSIVAGARQVGSGSASTITRVSMNALLQLSVGDYIELYGWISEGGRSIAGGVNNTFLHGYLVSLT